VIGGSVLPVGSLEMAVGIMAQIDPYLSTGLPELDRVLKGLAPGDNIVWQVGSVEEYARFVKPYSEHIVARGGHLIYFQFASHPALLADDSGAEIHHLDPEEGFETFLSTIHAVIERSGRGAFYVFDCLSELVVDWYSDQMLGNFFRLTCPYLFDLETIAYFGLLRNHHSVSATTAITHTTQVLLDVYSHRGELYLHPIKVQQRHTPRMSMLHVWRNDSFTPISQSSTVAEILTSNFRKRTESANTRPDVWTQAFLDAETLAVEVEAGLRSARETEPCLRRLLRMAISRDERMLSLAERYFTLEDVLRVGRRVIGTGLVGGKSVGMLLARAILERTDPAWGRLLEPHDSFYVGSDVFYTFLVRNGIWWIRQKQRDPETFLEGAESARQRCLTGDFDEAILNQFAEMLDYFGGSPIIVRSSSLLEDNFGNAFAGKYESIFCANQGSQKQRLADFLSAVRAIYASTMSRKALVYRRQRGLLDQDEQMALLVQRVSGALYGELFFPQLGGVGLSYNPYVWSRRIDPNAGALRVVFGLGTRAVDRNDNDFSRVVALNAPQRHPNGDQEDSSQYTQRRVDVLDLEANHLVSHPFKQVAREVDAKTLQLYASRPSEDLPWRLTFKSLLGETDFVAHMRRMLHTLQEAYACPVDVEFTANFFDGRSTINVVQCRPLQVVDAGAGRPLPTDVDAADLIFKASSAVIGHSRAFNVDRFIYVCPRQYGLLGLQDRYAVARLIGRLAHAHTEDRTVRTVLLGPGRWGTTTPSLGVPISYADINTVSVVCEVAAIGENLMPDASLGTHLFNELVEMDILYTALLPHRDGNILNAGFFENNTNHLPDQIDEDRDWTDVVKVIEAADAAGDRSIVLNADVLTQTVMCYFDEQGVEET